MRCNSAGGKDPAPRAGPHGRPLVAWPPKTPNGLSSIDSPQNRRIHEFQAQPAIAAIATPFFGNRPSQEGGCLTQPPATGWARGADSRVITLQNGVDSVERLAPILGAEAVIAGTTYVVTTIAKPGVGRVV
jgi:hypothetical protein